MADRWKEGGVLTGREGTNVPQSLPRPLMKSACSGTGPMRLSWGLGGEAGEYPQKHLLT